MAIFRNISPLADIFLGFCNSTKQRVHTFFRSVSNQDWRTATVHDQNPLRVGRYSKLSFLTYLGRQ